MIFSGRKWPPVVSHHKSRAKWGVHLRLGESASFSLSVCVRVPLITHIHFDLSAPAPPINFVYCRYRCERGKIGMRLVRKWGRGKCMRCNQMKTNLVRKFERPERQSQLHINQFDAVTANINLLPGMRNCRYAFFRIFSFMGRIKEKSLLLHWDHFLRTRVATRKNSVRHKVEWLR